MPYQWVDPELFLEFAGVAVYHCYDDGNTVSWYWYTTYAADCNYEFPETDQAQFDVRKLPDIGLNAFDLKNHAPIIKHAISAGLITGEPVVKSDQMSFPLIFGQAVETLFTQPSVAKVFKNTSDVKLIKG